MKSGRNRDEIGTKSGRNQDEIGTKVKQRQGNMPKRPKTKVQKSSGARGDGEGESMN